MLHPRDVDFCCKQLCIVVAVLSLVLPRGLEAGKFNRVLSPGDRAPEWQPLPGVDGKRHALRDFEQSQCVVVLFWANTCPMAKQYEGRIAALTKAFAGPKVAFVAISVSQSPADRLPAMVQRAKQSGYRFTYLHDATQETGRRYGAIATPQVFVLDEKRRIAYQGAIDDHRNAEQVEFRYLHDAIQAVLAKKTPEIRESRPFGCEIEYAEPDDNSSSVSVRSTASVQ